MSAVVDAPWAAPVSLTEVLHAREQRVERQRAMLARHGKPLVSLTLVMPGPVKDGPLARELYGAAVAELDALVRACGWTLRSFQERFPPTGPEALYAIDTDARELKRALVALEDAHVLGRLWDMDVICPEAGSISRGSLGFAARGCLLCDEPGHACARSRRHPLAELMAAIEEKVRGYRARHNR